MKAEPEYRQPLLIGTAVLVAPLFGVTVGWYLTWLLFVWAEPGGLQALFFMMWVGCLYGFPVMLFVGLPIHLYLVHRKIRSLKVYLVLGGVIGLPIAVFVAMIDALKPYFAVFPVISAIVTAVMFWWIAVRPYEGSDRLPERI